MKKLYQSKFVRNVTIVAAGTAGAQAITIAFAPVVTRLYGPEAFGVLGSFAAILAIMTPVAALTYPTAIVLPKGDGDARGIATISVIIAAVMACATALILLVAGNWISSTFALDAISDLLYLIPVAMFFSAIQRALEQWLIRHKAFKAGAHAAVIQSLTINVSKGGAGLIQPSGNVLVLITTFGLAWHALLLWLATRTQKSLSLPPQDNEERQSSLRELAWRHRDFPLCRAPQVVINAFSQGLPVLLLAAFFGSAAAGFYTLGRTVLAVPTILIGKSVGDVFYPRITEAVRNGENSTRLLVKSTCYLAIAGLMPFGIVMAFGPRLFSITFGADWVVAGEYAQWLAAWLFFNFVNKPAVAAIPSLQLQGWLLRYEIFSTASKILALYVGFSVLGSDKHAVALMCIAGVVAYIVLIAYTFYISRSTVNLPQAET